MKALEDNLPSPETSQADIEAYTAYGSVALGGSRVEYPICQAVIVRPEEHPGERLESLIQTKIKEIGAFSARPLSDSEITLIREAMTRP